MAIDWDAVKKRAKQVDDSYYGERKRSERTAQPSDSPSFPRSELTGLAYEALRSGTLPMTTPAGRVTVPTGAAAQRASMLRDYAQLADDQKRGRLEGELYQLTQPGRVYNQETTQRNRARAAEIQGELDGLLPRESGRFKSGVQSILSSAMGAVPAIAATAKSLDWSIGEERNREESRQLAELDRKIRALEGSRRGDALDHIRGTDEWKALAAQRRALSLQATPAVDMDDPGMRLMRESNQYREQALEGLEGVPRFLGGTALSIGQNAALLPLATVNPALPLAAMGTISAADRMYELGERGLPASEALSRGLISGGIEAATEKIPLDTLLDAMKTGGKGALRNILRQAGTEAGEESVSYLANYLMDKAYKDPEAEFSLAELAQAAAGGALSGGVFGGFGSAYNAVGERLNQPVALPVAAPVDRDVTTGYDGTKPYRRGDMNDGRGEEAPSAARDIYGADVWGEAQKTYPGGKSTHPQADRTVGSQRPAADWAKGHIVERPATPAGAAAARAGRYLPDVFVVDDAALKAQNPSAWALTQDGVTYISDALPAELADIVGYHEAVHAVKQRGFPEYHTLLDQIGGSLNHQSDRTDLVLGVILRSRFQGKEIMDLNLDELMTAYDELNALVWGYYKADPDNARTQFAGVFRDYDKYIRLLDGVMEAGRMAETPPIAVPRQTQGPVDLPIAERRAQTPPLADENGETTSVGAAPMGFDEWSHFQNQSGQFFPEGANAARPVDVPTTDPSGRNIRKTASTAMGARAIPDEVVGDIQQMVLSGQLSYDRVTDQDSIRRAIAQIEQDGGFQRALGDFSRAVQKGVVSKDLATLGQQLLVNAANAGDGKATAELLSLYAQMETAAGQAVQAASILRKLDPSYQLYAAQKAVDRLQETLSRKLKGRDITIDPALIEKFEQQTDQAGRDAVLEEIYQNVADQVPATWQDKWNAWRYLAMLGNPRTHIRNIAGNAGFMPVRFVKDRVAALIEAGISAGKDGFQRTKSFAYDPKLYAAAWADYPNVAEALSGSKYDDIKSIIEDRRTIFQLKPLEAARRGNSNLLSMEDATAKRVTYAGALAGYLNANGVTAEQLRAGTADPKVLNAARNYAGQEAQRATFNDKNQFSDTVVRTARSLGTLGEAVLPFKRTPANILVRGLEYSPAGLAKSVLPIKLGPLKGDLYKVRKGEMSAAEAIDHAAAGLTGTGLLALGAYLASLGLVSGGADDDEKQEALDDLVGRQSYALNLPGGGSVTLDWLAPEALPFFMGAQLFRSLGENGLTAESITDALTSVSEPMLEMSMLQSLNDLIDNVSYAASNEKLSGLLWSSIVSYLTQAIPTLGGQLERSGEDVRMTTYTDKNLPLPTDAQYALGKASARLPGWDYQQIPYVDAWGRQEETGDPIIRSIHNLFNPAYTDQRNVTAVDEEVQRLYDQTGEGGVVPSRANRYIIVDGNHIDLSAEQYVKYATMRGQTAYDLADKLIQSGVYQGFTDEEKARALDMVYTYADAVSKADLPVGYQPEEWVGEVKRAVTDLGLSEAEYLAYRSKYGAAMSRDKLREAYQSGLSVDAWLTYADADRDRNGDDSVNQAEIIAAIESSGLSAADKNRLYQLELSDAGRARWERIRQWGMSIDDYLTYYPIYAATGKGITKEVKLQQLQNAGMSAAQADDFWDLMSKGQN